MTNVTQILARIESGDSSATEQLLPLVYNELRRLAARFLAHEKLGQTLQPTALVHEAYLRLVGGESSQRWNSRGHFFSAAAEAMRRILVDRARQKLSIKGGGQRGRKDVDADKLAATAPPAEVVAVHDALDSLAAVDTLAADLVKLRYFAGFSIEESAEILQLSRATAYRTWTYARAWLRASLDEQHPADDSPDV
jgi:RNA polymerase sigma factor (TIGR02999 family)